MSKLLTGNIRTLYLKYLATCFGSALIICIYSLVDMVAVGQYEGPDGSAALTTVLPLWSLIFSLGMLFGVGGSVLMSTARGAGRQDQGDQYFTAASIGAAAVTAAAWIVVLLFDRPLLMLFGAQGHFLELGLRYVFWIKWTLPLFLLGPFLSAFIRNDHAPGLATIAVVAGGCFNIFGDLFFVFTCDMGASGAGLATAAGQCIAAAILAVHFFTKKCHLRFVRPKHFFSHIGRIAVTGFSSFIVNIAMGVLATLFNNQIMAYADSAALAVYGVASNVSALVQSCGDGVGQAAQPILSENYGAKLHKRVAQTRRLGLCTVALLGVLFTTVTMLFPTAVVDLFMSASPAVHAIAPGILRVYFFSFALLPFNIFAAHYFQAVMAAGTSLLLSILRGIALSGALIYLLPLLFGVDALWWAMPAAELLTAALAVLCMALHGRKALAPPEKSAS